MEMADEGNYKKILRARKINFLVLPQKIKSLKSRLFWGLSGFSKTTKTSTFYSVFKKSNFKISNIF